MGRMDLPFDPDAFADTPLFRELQRVLTSSSGPVNWELARQIGIATAQEGLPDPAPTDEDRRALEEAVRVAELHVARLTGLTAPVDVAPIRVVRRAEWITANVESLRAVLEPAAAKIGAAIGAATRDAVPSELSEMTGILGQLSPLLLGAQVGAVLGSLGRQVLGQYDVAVPRAAPGELLF